MSFPRIALLMMTISTSGLGIAHAADKTLSVDEFAINASASQPAKIKDPFERINRKIFTFNQYLDQHALLPAARLYQALVPSPVNTGITHFFSNLAEPWTAVNQLLQGKPRASAVSMGRFTVNTFTTLGLADPASVTLKLQKSREDLGQTLGVWGIGSGPFLMLPFRGPSTLRDTAAMVIDQQFSPQQHIHSGEAYAALVVAQAIDARADLIGVESLVTGDQYPVLRDVYLQRRQFQVDDGQPNDHTAPLDESFGDDTELATQEPTPSDPPTAVSDNLPVPSDQPVMQP
jgi:phospholipid-binding lipoprotein MlaA